MIVGMVGVGGGGADDYCLFVCAVVFSCVVVMANGNGGPTNGVFRTSVMVFLDMLLLVLGWMVDGVCG